jgi:uroporphyrinogen III methyltransferase/synthase
VTAGIAAPAYAGIPVTHRGLSTSVTFVTGHEDPEKTALQTDWRALGKAGGTIVVYMGVKNLPRIAAALTEGGMPVEIPAAAIEWGTHPRQRTVVATLGTLAERMTAERIGPPVIVVIGWTVVLRDEIRWFDHAPLFGKRIVVTRAEEGLGRRGLGARLREMGAEVIETPLTRIERLDPARARATLQEIDEFQWVCFTSANGVRFFWETMREVGRDARSLAGIRVCAVGPMTAEALLQHGIAVDVVAERFVAEGLLEVLARREDVPGARVLYASAEGARETLPAGLEGMGADVERLPLYRSAPNEPGLERLRGLLRERPADLVAFTSGSAVRSYAQGVGPELAQATGGASIGPATTAVARELGIPIVVEAAESTLAALADAIIAAYVGDDRGEGEEPVGDE